MFMFRQLRTNTDGGNTLGWRGLRREIRWQELVARCGELVNRGKVRVISTGCDLASPKKERPCQIAGHRTAVACIEGKRFVDVLLVDEMPG